MTTPVPWSDNTEFPNALTSAAITLVGLQSGGNVKVPPNALARAIQDAIALSVAFNFAGNITANNLSGVNTGDQVGALLAANNLSDVASAVASLDHIRKTGADIIASATTNIGAASGESINLTGTATITAFDVAAAGIRRTTRVVNAGLTFTHNGVTLQCITGANIVAAGGDQCEFLSLSSGNWRMLWYTRADGTPLVGGGGGSTVAYGVATGTNTYAATMSPVVSSYTIGALYLVKFTNGNSGASTIDLGPGAKTIQQNGVALSGAELPSNCTVPLLYDGTNLQIVGTASATIDNFLAVAFEAWG